jgi:predicted Zn-dependent protease
MVDADSGDTSPADLAADVCERTLALVGDGDEALVGAVVGTSSLTRFANSRIHQNVTEALRAVTLTLAVDGRVAKATTTRTDGDGLAALVDRARAAAVLRPEDPDYPGLAPPAPVADPGHWDDATAGATPEQRAEVVAAFVEAGGGFEAAGYCSTTAVHTALASTTGQRAAGRRSRAQLDGIHRAVVGGDHPADGFAQISSAALGALDGAACGARAAAKAGASLDPRSLPPGAYEVVLEPKAVAAALAYPAWFGLNGKQHAEGTSFVHLGEQQWDANVHLWDDALDPRAVGSAYDAEGTPKARLDLVSAGMSVGVAHDRRSARLAGVAPTGHSVGNDSFGAFPADLFMGGGEASPEDLVAAVGRGLLVTDLWYNRILDPKTQVVTGLTRNGLFLIEDGEVVGPVQNMRYTQSIVGGFGPGRVLGLGNDGQLVGDEGGSLMFLPTVRLGAWAFTGNAQG